jgi:hypothetical protein
MKTTVDEFMKMAIGELRETALRLVDERDAAVQRAEKAEQEVSRLQKFEQHVQNTSVILIDIDNMTVRAEEAEQALATAREEIGRLRRKAELAQAQPDPHAGVRMWRMRDTPWVRLFNGKLLYVNDSWGIENKHIECRYQLSELKERGLVELTRAEVGAVLAEHPRIAWKAGYDKAQRDARAKKRKMTK